MNNEPKRPPMAVILATDVGLHLRPLTNAYPISLLSVGGGRIIERIIRNCLSCGISQFVLVLGHRADQIKKFVDKAFRGIRVTYIINKQYRSTNTGYSLMLASTAIGSSEFIKFDTDVVFDVKILQQLTDDGFPNILCFDPNAIPKGEDWGVIIGDQIPVQSIDASANMPTTVPKTGPYTSIGIEEIGPDTGPLLFTLLTEMMEDSNHHQDSTDVAYSHMTSMGIEFNGLAMVDLQWSKINTIEDFTAANVLFVSPIETISRVHQQELDEAKESADTPITSPT